MILNFRLDFEDMWHSRGTTKKASNQARWWSWKIGKDGADIGINEWDLEQN